MKRALLLTALVFGLSSLSSFAQATRTWVSGVGDDANPGSRTAPCKTFAGAISKTAADGEINALDSGGFGAVTITKSILIDGAGNLAGVLVAGVPGIVINNGGGSTPIVVTLRHLSINGIGSGTVGIKVLGNAIVHVEDCVIHGFTGDGITFAPSDAGSGLFVKNCRIFDCAGNAISLSPAVGASCSIQNTNLEGCAAGVVGQANSLCVVENSSAIGNSGTGFSTDLGATMSLESTRSCLNAIGLYSAGTMTISNVSVLNNSGPGLSRAKSAILKSWHNNKVTGNTPDGTASGGLPQR
jgi:hypothetical protein